MIFSLSPSRSRSDPVVWSQLRFPQGFLKGKQTDLNCSCAFFNCFWSVGWSQSCQKYFRECKGWSKLVKEISCTLRMILRLISWYIALHIIGHSGDSYFLWGYWYWIMSLWGQWLILGYVLVWFTVNLSAPENPMTQPGLKLPDHLQYITWKAIQAYLWPRRMTQQSRETESLPLFINFMAVVVSSGGQR